MRCTTTRGVRIAALALLLSALVEALAAAQSAPAAVPVMVGGMADLDACGAVGKVVGLNPKGDNFLAVRSGPGTNFPKLDELREGALVTLCAEETGWLGIVYSHDDTDCGVSTPRPERAPYRGPCRSGWVSRRYVSPIAG